MLRHVGVVTAFAESDDGSVIVRVSAPGVVGRDVTALSASIRAGLPVPWLGSVVRLEMADSTRSGIRSAEVTLQRPHLHLCLIGWLASEVARLPRLSSSSAMTAGPRATSAGRRSRSGGSCSCVG